MPELAETGSEAICAGIVTFNPDIGRLLDNIQAIAPQVDKVLIFDNFSTNRCDILRVAKRFSNVDVEMHESNAGVALALNQLANRAAKHLYKHILFLDQDSVAASGMVRALSAHTGPRVALVAPQIIDRNKKGFTRPESLVDGEVIEIGEAARKGVISSGSLVSLSVFQLLGGCDEAFFIDYVDYDLNKRMLLEGFQIIRTGETYLLHEVGHARRTILWTPRRDQNGRWHLERFYSFGHSPDRCYYKARNRILFSKKYRRLSVMPRFEGRVQILPQVVLTMMFEKERRLKLMAFVRGVMDGERTRVSPYCPKRLALTLDGADERVS